MPRCFFHIHDGITYMDKVGIELPNIRAVQAEAVRVSVEFLANHQDKFWEDKELRLDVTDANGRTLFTLTFLVEAAPMETNLALLNGSVPSF